MRSKCAANILMRIGLVVLLPLLLLTACALPEHSPRQEPEYLGEPLLPGHGRLNVFFALKDSRAPAVRLAVDEIAVLEDDVWLPVTSQPRVLDSEEIADGQIFLGAITLPQGSYSRLRFQLTN